MTLDMTVKFAEGSDTIIEGLAVPFGLDLDGQQFSAKSDLCLDWFPNGGRPVLFHHGFDETIKMAPIGRELEAKTTDAGLWIRAQLDKASKYYERIKPLIDAGALGWSSAAPDHKVKIAGDGHIDRWPLVEHSLTPTPSKPNTVAYAMKSAQVLEALEAVKAEIPESLRETPLEVVNNYPAKVAKAFAEGIEQTHEGDTVPESLAEHSEQVLAGMKAWVERMEERSDFRMKVGRELSRANIEALRTAYQTIGALLEKADKPSEDEERATEARKALAEFQRLEAARLGIDPG